MAITTGGVSGTVPIGIFGDNILTNISTTDHLIQGQMITAQVELTSYDREHLTDEQIKMKLINLLTEEIVKKKCVEFTKQDDFASNVTVARARIFVTPDTNVKILRTYQNDNKSY